MSCVNDAVSCIDAANHFNNDAWKIRLFTERDRKLVLCGCKGSLQLAGVLVFTNTVYIRMPTLIVRPVFNLTQNISSNSISSNAYSSRYHLKITAEKVEYAIYCDNVNFYSIEK
jgi:hypothetical protein